MKKIKIGYLPFYIKLYDDSDPHARDPMVGYMQAVMEMLRTQGLEIVEADEICRVKEEFNRAASKFNDEEVVAVITHHLAYSPSLESIEALLSLKAPLIVLDTTPAYELVKVASYEDRIHQNHGIHGVQDMCNLLKRNGRDFYLCVGHVLHSEVLSEVVSMCKAAAAARLYQTETIGMVGEDFPGMGDFKISEERYQKEIGAVVKHLSSEEAKKYLSQVTEDEIEAEVQINDNKYSVQVRNQNNYREALRSGIALRKWMNREKIQAATVNFLRIDESGLPKMPFIECCKMMERGMGYAGEGDVLTAGLVGALIRVWPDTTFTEMFCPDWEKDLILLSHMGESNPNLAQWKPLITDKEFPYNSTGDTVAMYNCYRAGQVILVNLAPMEDHFDLIVTAGEIVEEGLERGAYARATQGWYRPCKKLTSFLKEYSLAGGTHHSALLYHCDMKEITAFGKMMGFHVVEIK